MRKFSLQVFIILFYLHALFAQSNQWPFIFIAPEKPEEQNDSSYLYFSNQFSYYEQLKNEFNLDYVKSGDNLVFKQLYEHSLTRYSDQTYNQYVNLSGNVSWKKLSFLQSEPGFIYEPKLNYIRRRSGSSLQSNINSGPFLRMRPFQIPVKLSAGMSGVVNEELPGDISSLPLRSYHGDAGFYGGFEIGDSVDGVAGKPLFVNVKVLGKTIEGIGSGLVMGNALFLHQLESGDSLYIYGADTLLNGKDLELSNQITPWKINHSFQGAAGVKLKERKLGFTPAALYRFWLSTTEHPKAIELVDIKNLSHSVNFLLMSTDRYFFDYRGGLEITWNEEDHYFRNKSNQPHDLKDFNDHRSDLARSDHQLRINFPKNIAVEYEVHAQKDSKKYNDSLNENEKDYIIMQHHWGICADSLAGVSTELYTEYSKTYLYYFREMNSAQSKIIEDYRIGFNICYVNRRLRLEERFFIDAEKNDYKFKDPSKLPPYTRSASSKLTGNFLLTDKVELIGAWDQKYNDNGYWYGKDYFAIEEAPSQSYYAINSKTFDHTLHFYTKLEYKLWSITAGTSYRNITQRNFDSESDSYKRDEGRGYTLDPTLRFRFKVGFLAAEGKIGRHFDSLDENRWSVRENWDLLLIMRAMF